SNVCLGHRRLSIIDIERSIQPWTSGDGRYTIVFNGEIYNYIELRKELESSGYRFKTHGDTEVLLNLFIDRGYKCLEKLNGMFAFAVWDKSEKQLFLARDRMGKKPVFYSLLGDSFAFCSELVPLLSFNEIDKSLDLKAVQDYFAYQFIPGERSIYRGVQKLRPGHYLIYKNGRLVNDCYWAPPHSKYQSKTIKQASEELVDLVDDAVRIRLRSDVPLGAFLSGGIDSSIIVGTMKRIGADVNTFTVGFSETSFDESQVAAATAAFFGTNHRSKIIDITLPSLIDQYLTSFGEPYADPSALPTWFLCQYVQKYVTVALSGDGSDELFGGYRRYLAAGFVGSILRLPAWVRSQIIHRVINKLEVDDRYYGASYKKKIKLFGGMLKRFEETPRDYLPQTFTLSERKKLFKDSIGTVNIIDHENDFGLSGYDRVEKMILTDIRTYLSEDILTKVDRMSMAHSLEVRAPFLDYRIVEFACRLPLNMKINKSRQKIILREAYKNMLPKQISRMPKHGFSVPVGGWLKTELRPLFETTVLDVADPDFIDGKEVHRIWSDHISAKADNGFKLWTILLFYYWYYNTRQ
ncbi:MAG: asparagine synthase (glutamine-hydrolyzing), partial [Candidatus Scalindua sp.]